ncbi:hypothetical protein C1645_747597 [Glomus cerebriforme]|uniref:Uncharacterized protein n=1 Tax=Glomus cerebriforme TaxID=658196 RepID=A0A397TRE4_9GLOM|nr:hypothetical protein C1645_747597 [Glomus cerebriforme]
MSDSQNSYDSNYYPVGELAAVISVLLGEFISILIVYIYGVCKNKKNNNFIMFYALLIIYDWIFNIIFTIWTFVTGLYTVSIIPLSVMIIFNSILTITILCREFKNNDQFRVWFQEHKAFAMLIGFFSLDNVNVLHVLNCKYNCNDKFDAKLSFTAEKKIIHASVISLIIGDLPRFLLLLMANLNLPFYAIPVISLFLNILVISFGFFYRIYESMIRGYEQPTIPEFVVSKKQFLEA